MNYVRTTDAPKLPAPANLVGVWATLRDRFFPTPISGLATIVIGGLAGLVIWTIFDWAVVRGVFGGENREVCAVEGAGACWPFARARFPQWIYGFYPIPERWRANLVFLLGIVTLVPLAMPSLPYKYLNAALFFIVYPIASFMLLLGGQFGLTYVETAQWGGLLVTLIISAVGIVVSLPLGVLLALGRRSEMPVIKTLCVAFIEMVRGVPFLTILFMASVMFPLFMPPGTNFDKLLRVLVGTSLFSAAYIAEEVRGGLQAIPKGQYEAARALGLPYWKLMGLIVMPQALKIVIPGLVNNSIGLFKDTSLVAIIGIFDLLNMVQAGFNDAKWASPQTGNTGYFALAIIYTVFCFAMSRYSMFIERRLNTGHKR
jgi:general L-amino acid transport system permease protein